MRKRPPPPKSYPLTAAGKPNPMQYCSACTRTVNTEQDPEAGCAPAPWCRKRLAQSERTAAHHAGDIAPEK